MKRGQYFEDVSEGETYTTPGITMTQDAIVRFALDWDIQPFHVDAHAAQKSIFGSLIASGLHTVMVSYRLFNQAGIFENTAIAGLGYSDVRFLKPVKPNDTLYLTFRIANKRLTKRADGGVVTVAFETRTQDGTLVLTLQVSVLVALRPSAP